MQERGAAPALSGSPPAGGGGRRLLLAAVVAAAVVTADQVTKTWAVHRLSHGSIHVVWKLDLILSYNTGAAFGLAQGWAPVIGAFAVLIVLVLLGLARQVHSLGLALAYGLVMGGAVGNLCDRVFRSHHGAVVDFIALHFWPTFNVADACVVIGTVGAALSLWRRDRSSALPADDR